MKFKQRVLVAFTLVEVVLAVGVVSFALLAIFSLFSTALRTNSETLSQQEALGVTRAFTGYLGSTNVGFSNVFTWAKDPVAAPEVYIYSDEDGAFQYGLGSDTAFVGKLAARPGRLFRMVLELSRNMPLRDASGAISEARPSASVLPASAASYTNDAALALKVRVFDVAAPGLPITNLQPVLTYDAIVPR
jgi:hypothetical protein